MTTEKPENEGDKPRSRAGKQARSTPSPSAQQEGEVVRSRPRPYLVAPRSQASLMAMGVALQPFSSEELYRRFEQDPRVKVRRRLRSPARTGLLNADGGTAEVLVVDMDYEYAYTLSRQLPQVIIERDRLLTYATVTLPETQPITPPALPLGVESTFTFVVQDADGKALPDVSVFVTGTAWPAQAVTDESGRATVTLIGETPESIRSLLVKPPFDYWSLYLERPALSTDRDNVVRLKKLSDTFPDFPDRQVRGWGQLAMHLDRLPPTFRGAGAKVAIIDSGAAVEHTDLRDRISRGRSLVDEDEQAWTVDTVRHGSHCAGIITGADNDRGIVGFAVEAEVHAIKIFPGGRFSDLLEALDYCIDHEIDVVNLSLGSRHSSELLAAKIAEAREMGVACIVAAGNDGGPVNFPGNLPYVLTVAAIGKVGTFPDDSGHAAEIHGPQTGDGYFSAAFTSYGPEVDVCAPGVAVLSSVPPDNYAVWDGTSMAAPHVAGLAALLIAHHGDFRGEFRERNARRVDRLFQIIKSSCVPLDLGDPHRTGAGLPDALRALGPAFAGISPVSGDAQQLLDRLTNELIQAGLLDAQPVPGPVGTPDVQLALVWLDEEMRAAGLSPTPVPGQFF